MLLLHSCPASVCRHIQYIFYQEWISELSRVDSERNFNTDSWLSPRYGGIDFSKPVIPHIYFCQHHRVVVLELVARVNACKLQRVWFELSVIFPVLLVFTDLSPYVLRTTGVNFLR